MTLLALTEVALVIRLFEVERTLGLPTLMPLVVVGFVVHACLPLRFRIPFFLLLGVAASVLLFGPASSVLLYAAGLTLVGACHLPVSHVARVGAVLLITVGLGLLRLDWVDVPGAKAVLPVLASMFMFRLIVYLYDLRYEAQPVPWPTRLAYFFLLPNLCFTLFPVVDYQRFTQCHYASDAEAIHRRGVAWMLLGVVQILACRVIQVYLVPAPEAIRGLQGVLVYALTAYLQYLRISGIFHVAVGMLCIFGFDLPASNRWYFLAADYADLWRRANSYWREFLQKIVYFPVFMRFRKTAGVTPALALATVAVFSSSAALHTWQWFWLRGELLLSEVDVVFWSLVGGVVVVSTVRGTVAPKAATPRSPLREAIARTGKTALIFGATCLLWSLWRSESLEQWFSILARGRYVSPRALARLVAAGAAVLSCGVLLSWLWATERLPDPEPMLRRGRWLVGASGAMIALSVAAEQDPGSRAFEWVVEPRALSLGYYEGLLGSRVGGGSGAAGPWVAEARAPEWLVPTRDLRLYRLRPSSRCSRSRAIPCRTNEHGMRGPSRSAARDPGVVRLALLGSSPELGFKVADGAEFPRVLERLLGPAVEVLNFAVIGYGPVQQVGALEQALAFDPDLVLLVSHCRADLTLTSGYLKGLVEAWDRGYPFPEGLEDFAPPRLDGAEAREAWLRSRLEPLTRWAYRRIAETTEAHGAIPVWVYVPLPQEPGSCFKPGTAEVEGWARAAGFETVRLQHIYPDSKRVLRIPGDAVGHPSVVAHRRIARRLAERLKPWLGRIEASR